MPRSSSCPSVSVTPRTPGLYGYLTNTCTERTSASVSLKPSEYFIRACAGAVTENVWVSQLCWFECYARCRRYTRSHQFFMFAVQSYWDGLCHIFLWSYKYLVETLRTNCLLRPITVWILFRSGWAMIVSHQLHLQYHIHKLFSVTFNLLLLLKNVHGVVFIVAGKTSCLLSIVSIVPSFI